MSTTLTEMWKDYRGIMWFFMLKQPGSDNGWFGGKQYGMMTTCKKESSVHAYLHVGAQLDTLPTGQSWHSEAPWDQVTENSYNISPIF